MNPYALLSIEELIATVRLRPDCEVFAPAGQPVVREGHQLPDDLLRFYGLCGGMTMFPHIAFHLTILPARRVVVANPVIMGLAEVELIEDFDLGPNEPSWAWYTLAVDANGDYFVIDLSEGKLGRCYDGHWDVYPQRGATDILALSFTDFLARMLLLIETSPSPDHHWPVRLIELRLGDAYD